MMLSDAGDSWTCRLTAAAVKHMAGLPYSGHVEQLLLLKAVMCHSSAIGQAAFCCAAGAAAGVGHVLTGSVLHCLWRSRGPGGSPAGCLWAETTPGPAPHHSHVEENGAAALVLCPGACTAA